MSKYAAKTGRVRRYESDVQNNVPIDQRLLPVSCTIYLYKKALHELLEFCSKSLRFGSGVKVHFGSDDLTPEKLTEIKEWYFMIDEAHPDFNKIFALPTYLRTRYLSPAAFKNRFGDNPYLKHRIITVADSMQENQPGKDSIEESWYSFEVALQLGYVPIVDLSHLRPAGTPSGSTTAAKQLIATGPLGMGDDPRNPESGSFVSIYARIFDFLRSGDIVALMQLLGQLNRTLLQGREKTGIICTGIDYESPHVERYLNFPLMKLLGSQKKAIRIDEGLLEFPELMQLICAKVNSESLFLEKKLPGGLLSNVCGEIAMLPEATCNLQHTNAGMIEKPGDIPQAMAEVSYDLIQNWLTWRDNVSPDVANIYLPLEDDRQVGLGWIGWANFMANQQVTYYEFAHTLKNFLDEVEQGFPNIRAPKTTAEEICMNLYVGYIRCSEMGEEYGIDRMFTIAPTQSLFATTKDINGNTCSRGIVAPFARRIRRSSDSKKSQFVFHGKEIEIASEVGSDVHELLHDQWQRLMNLTGKAHTITYDLWHNIDVNWLTSFITEMNLVTTYYNFSSSLNNDYLDKGKIQQLDVNSMTCDCAQ